MSSFENVTLKWDGKDYTIPANRMMGAIARIEDVVTLFELRNFALRGGAPLGKLCMAYGSVLRYAGCNVTDEEIYVKMAEAGDENSSAVVALKNIMTLMLPPALRKRFETQATEEVAAKELPKGN